MTCGTGDKSLWETPAHVNHWHKYMRHQKPVLLQRSHVVIIDLIHKSQNTPAPYPTMLHSEQKCVHFCSEWDIVGYGTGAFWDLWNWSILLAYGGGVFKWKPHSQRRKGLRRRRVAVVKQDPCIRGLIPCCHEHPSPAVLYQISVCLIPALLWLNHLLPLPTTGLADGEWSIKENK